MPCRYPSCADELRSRSARYQIVDILFPAQQLKDDVRELEHSYVPDQGGEGAG